MINTSISGKTEIYGLIGDPVSHSLSPFIHNTLAEKSGDDIAYASFRVKPDELEKAVSGAHSLSIKGLNITIPHKAHVMDFLVEIERTALEAGAVNTLLYKPNGYCGFNTDVTGIAKTFETRKIDITGKKIVILGAGGGARAAAIAMAKGGASEINIVNRSEENTYTLAGQVNMYYQTAVNVVKQNEIEDIGRADIMINATSMGFGSQAGKSPVKNAEYLKQIDVLLDIIYIPWETRLISDAKQKGVFCINGFDMLIYQAVSAYEIWREKKLSRELVSELIDELKSYCQKK